MPVFAIPTLLGKAALAAAIDAQNPVPVTISAMVVGDGNGGPVTPLETQTSLVNTRATAPVESSTRAGAAVTFEAVFDQTVGPFTITEAGLLDDDGQLLFVASTPATEKLTPAENVDDILTLGLIVVVAANAQVILLPPVGSLVSVAQMLRAPFIAVESASLTAPPSSPAAGATYRVPTGATGAWAGHTDEITQWTGQAWVFKAVPDTHLIGVAATGGYLKKTAAGWVNVYLSPVPIDEDILIHFGTM